MSPQERKIIQEIAAKLERLRDEANAVDQPFLAYLIEMARLRRRGPAGEQSRRRPMSIRPYLRREGDAASGKQSLA